MADKDGVTDLRGIKNDEKTKYPYVVVRYMAAVYSRRQVVFKPSGHAGVENQNIVCIHPAPFANGKLKQECVEELVDILKDLTHSSGFRMCLVLAENSCIFVEPDGQTKISDDPPSGGVKIKSVGEENMKKTGLN